MTHTLRVINEVSVCREQTGNVGYGAGFNSSLLMHPEMVLQIGILFRNKIKWPKDLN